MRKVLKTLVLVAALIGLATVGYAQEATPEQLDWAKIADPVTVLLVYLTTYGIRLLLPKLPRLVVWTLPVTLGAILTYVQAAAGAAVGWQHYFIGAVAIALNEGLTTVKKHGVNG